MRAVIGAIPISGGEAARLSLDAALWDGDNPPAWSNLIRLLPWSERDFPSALPAKKDKPFQ